MQGMIINIMVQLWGIGSTIGLGACEKPNGQPRCTVSKETYVRDAGNCPTSRK